MHLWFKGCASTSTGNSLCRMIIISSVNTINRTGIQGDFSDLVTHRNNVFMVHHETCCTVAAEVNLENRQDIVKIDIFSCPII